MKRQMHGLALAGLLIGSVATAGALRGAILVAADGTFLGTCDGPYGRTSFANDYSPYGGAYGRLSIFNQYSLYGGAYAMYSPYNEYTMYAPYLLAADPELLTMFTSPSYRPSPQIVDALRSSKASRVTVNEYVIGAIDPTILRLACQNP